MRICIFISGLKGLREEVAQGGSTVILLSSETLSVDCYDLEFVPAHMVPLSHCPLSPQFFHNVEEAEWAVEVVKSTGKPTAITMCIGPAGDGNKVSPGDCAVRLARAGT